MSDVQQPSTDEASEFAESERLLRLARTKIGLALGALLMPGGFALDLFEYPQSLGVLTAIRIVTTLALASALLVVLRFELGQRIYGMSLVMLTLPVAGISAMIACTDGGASPYFIGLLLLLMVGQLLGLDSKEAAFLSLFTLATYVVAVIARGGPFVGPETLFVQGLFFIVSTGAVSITTCYITYRNRRDDFHLRKELDRKNQQLQELDRMRAGFLAAVTHELATPLSLILGPLDQLLADPATLPDAVRGSLTLLRKNAVRLRTLVDDLLDAVRMDNRMFHLNRERIETRDLLAAVLSAIRPHAESRGIELKLDLASEAAPIAIDVSRMERVLFNLLGNAIKFSPSPGVIDIVQRLDAQRVQISVRDHGPGIPVEEQARIFERFYQAANNPLRRSQGLGLGLALAREIVQSHGGDITVDSAVGEGTRFTVSLPLETAVVTEVVSLATEAARETVAEVVRLPTQTAIPGTLASSATSPPDAAELPTVLIVDDEHDLRNFLSDSLRAQYRTVSAATAAEGAALAASERPSVVLLDYMLPDDNGLAVARHIREEPSLADSKIIMLTAVLDENVKIEALRCGVDDFLSKPFSVTEIRARVDGLLRSSQLQAELRNEREQLRRSLLQLRKTEKQLFQSEKLRAIGNLAAGLLHEINNPVNIAQMAVEVIPRRLQSGKDVTAILADVQENLQRVADIISDLRAFAYPQQEHVHGPLPMMDAVTSAVRFTARDCEGITVKVDVAEDAVVQASKTQVTQLLVNLLVNSAAAVRKAETRSPEIVIRSAVRDERLFVTVADNGIGIAAEELSRVCDPFYTTAEVGKGMGLGLSICNTIASNHGGQLAIHSHAGVGTEVTFDLPLALHAGIDHGYAPLGS